MKITYEKCLEELRKEAECNNSLKDLSEVLNSIMQFGNIDRNTLLMLIERVYISKDKEIEIVFKFDNPK